MALLEPWRCQYKHPLCQLHGDGPADEPGPLDAAPKVGICAYRHVATKLWQTPRDGKWLCARHLRIALKAGGYPAPIAD